MASGKLDTTEDEIIAEGKRIIQIAKLRDYHKVMIQ